MTVLLGNVGYVELTRATVDTPFTSVVNGADVAVGKGRFSFDFPVGLLITGDRIEFRATDGGLLDFVAPSGWVVNEVQDRGTWYVNVDELGGIRLYNSFSDALNGEKPGQVQLAAPTRNILIEVRAERTYGSCLARVVSYEFNNARDAVDVTELSDDFRKQYSGLISGSGSFDCYFSYRADLCAQTNQPTEPAIYMHQLILRQRIGSQFKARLYVIGRGAGVGAAENDQVWYEFEGLITNSGLSVAPSQLIRSRIDFVTTGEIRLKAATAETSYLQQESRDFLLLEQDVASKLELDTM